MSKNVRISLYILIPVIGWMISGQLRDGLWNESCQPQMVLTDMLGETYSNFIFHTQDYGNFIIDGITNPVSPIPAGTCGVLTIIDEGFIIFNLFMLIKFTSLRL